MLQGNKSEHLNIIISLDKYYIIVPIPLLHNSVPLKLAVDNVLLTHF